MKICASAELTPGVSIRFPLDPAQGRFGPLLREGFAFRHADGAPRAYVNVCPHRGQPVDLGDGKLFTGGGALECQAHGALFEPATGDCRSGPCFGKGLSKLDVEERDGALWLIVRDEPIDDPE